MVSDRTGAYKSVQEKTPLRKAAGIFVWGRSGEKDGKEELAGEGDTGGIVAGGAVAFFKDDEETGLEGFGSREGGIGADIAVNAEGAEECDTGDRDFPVSSDLGSEVSDGATGSGLGVVGEGKDGTGAGIELGFEGSEFIVGLVEGVLGFKAVGAFLTELVEDEEECVRVGKDLLGEIRGEVGAGLADGWKDVGCDPMLKLTSGWELTGEDQGIEAGLVDDRNILGSAKGVAFCYPLVFRVNSLGQSVPAVCVPKDRGDIFSDEPGFTVNGDGTQVPELGVIEDLDFVHGRNLLSWY